MIFIFVFTVLLLISAYIFMQQSKFGRLPSGARLEKIKKSPNYRDGAFQNIHYTPDLAEDASYFSVMKEFFFGKKFRIRPSKALPSMKTDLKNLKADEDILVWFGHSSYFLQLDGKKILVDPVFSGAASPVAFTTRAFEGTDQYKAEDFPEIDYLFISHDHWDHLDYSTIMQLKGKIKKIITGLGTGEHFEYWGFDTNKIIEKDWNEEIQLEDGFEAFTVPARHFSGRALTRNQALWTAFVLKSPTSQILIGGDSGYDTHYKEIGQKFGVFDLVILENGQYDKSWKYIHKMPEEVLKAAKDLNAKRLFPVHSSKFALANHSWDTPLETITELNKNYNINMITPIIGEKVLLKDTNQQFKKWWRGID